MLYKIVTISDIHFGAIDPVYMYNNLQEQFIKRLANLNFDILAICGDLFDSKFMSNNPIISYTLSFIDNLVSLCRAKNASLVILEGTPGHDNGQLKLFYHYLEDPTLDFHIIEFIGFISLKGLRVLCIPEKYGLSEDVYKEVLFNSGVYDLCFLHGTFKGSFHGTEISTLNAAKAPIFSIGSFCNCAGPILMGHYHISSCFEEYAYYNGSAFRWQFGEEQDKGFLITLYDNRSRYHYTELVPINSYKYITININDIINNDPKMIIEHIKSYKELHNIDYIRVQYNSSTDNMNIVRSYFKNNSNVVLHELDRKIKQLEKIDNINLEQQQQYSFITDNQLTDYQKLVMYMNQQEGKEFITVDELITILEGLV